MISRLRARLARKQAARAAAFVDEVATEAMRPGLRVVRPARSPWGTAWDETVALHGDPGIRTTGARVITARVHGYALAAPLRGAR